MRRPKVLWQIYPAYVLITVLALASVAWYAAATIRKTYTEEKEIDLEMSARILARAMADRMSVAEADAVDRICEQLARESPTRLTVILPNGTVLGDSHGDLANMESHADRPEFRDALATGYGRSIRRSGTVLREMLYVAVPIRQNGDIVGVARASYPLTAIDESMKAIYARITVAGVIILVVSAIVSLVISERIAVPLAQMEQGAMDFARGDFSTRLPVPRSEELAHLAQAMNKMAAELDDRITTVIRQRNEHEAILSSMVEGVIAMDTDEHIFSVNDAAANMLKIDRTTAIGKSLQEVVRNVELQRLVSRVFEETSPAESDIALHGDGPRFLQAHGAILRDADSRAMGAVVVLNDVTRMRRLENIRRDFVANVSHELKTPITSIKGFVETLQDGALQNREDAERFLGVIAKQADRLNAIIEDLLLLSKLEQDSEKPSITLQEESIREILEAAAQICSVKAEEKDVELRVKCEKKLTARFNAPLIEQAVVNLVDNAVKYSESGSAVELTGYSTEREVVISVQDWGCGIEPQHQSRLFERFYRVDKARSRKLGGTGLGLAITKHIAQVHNGYVQVGSRVGEGSVFSVHLPTG